MDCMDGMDGEEGKNPLPWGHPPSIVSIPAERPRNERAVPFPLKSEKMT
jgi:hypothetical protein